MESIVHVLASAVNAAVGAVCEILDYARRRFHSVEDRPDTAYAPTAQDERYIAESRLILGEELPGGISRMEELPLEQRVETIRRLTGRVAECYGISVGQILFYNTDMLVRDGYPPNTFGYFLHDTGSVIYNIDLLAQNSAPILRDSIDTVFHECRHAYQYRVITDAGYLQSGDPTVKEWCYNFVHYHSAGGDLEAYYNQPIERDARNFTARIMEGI